MNTLELINNFKAEYEQVTQSMIDGIKEVLLDRKNATPNEQELIDMVIEQQKNLMNTQFIVLLYHIKELLQPLARDVQELEDIIQTFKRETMGDLINGLDSRLMPVLAKAIEVKEAKEEFDTMVANVRNTI